MKTFLILFFISSVQALDVSSCLVCHSQNEMQRGPSLEGMEEQYFIAQMNKFQLGLRGTHKNDHLGGLMHMTAKNMKPDDFAAYAKYFAQSVKKDHKQVIKGDAMKGQGLYQKQCRQCHVESAHESLRGPDLSPLEDWYILAQLKHFKAKRRGYDPRDLKGQIMSAQVQQLSDQELKDVTAYIFSLRTK